MIAAGQKCGPACLQVLSIAGNSNVARDYKQSCDVSSGGTTSSAATVKPKPPHTKDLPHVPTTGSGGAGGGGGTDENVLGLTRTQWIVGGSALALFAVVGATIALSRRGRRSRRDEDEDED
jgi:hypothetical protein